MYGDLIPLTLNERSNTAKRGFRGETKHLSINQELFVDIIY